jgi:hypothetical protein
MKCCHDVLMMVTMNNKSIACKTPPVEGAGAGSLPVPYPGPGAPKKKKKKKTSRFPKFMLFSRYF